MIENNRQQGKERKSKTQIEKKYQNGQRKEGQCISAYMCVRHIPFLASLQSRCDLQAWVSVTTFYCLQACEQGLLFGRSLNSKSNKLGFFIWQRFPTAMVFFRFPDRRAEGEDGGR